MIVNLKLIVDLKLIVGNSKKDDLRTKKDQTVQMIDSEVPENPQVHLGSQEAPQEVPFPDLEKLSRIFKNYRLFYQDYVRLGEGAYTEPKSDMYIPGQPQICDCSINQGQISCYINDK